MGDISRLPLRVLVVSAEADADSPGGGSTRPMADALRDDGVEVLFGRSVEAGKTLIAAESDVHAVLVAWELEGDAGDPGAAHGASQVIDNVRSRSDELPIFLMAARRTIQVVPTDVVRLVDGFLYPLDDTADWMAGRVRDAALKYRTELLPPMFGALVDFAQTHEYSWHTPGHEGGAAFRKSPVGRMFWEFFGEQTFRSDISVSVGELGSLLDHSGPIGRAEESAARIFGSDITYY